MSNKVFFLVFLLTQHEESLSFHLKNIWEGVTYLKIVSNDVNFNSIYEYNEDTLYFSVLIHLDFLGDDSDAMITTCLELR